MREMGRGTAWCLALLLLGLAPVHTSGEVTQGDLGFRCTLKEVKWIYHFPLYSQKPYLKQPDCLNHHRLPLNC